MMKSLSAKRLALHAAVFCAAALCQAQAPDHQRPDIVVFLTDDQSQLDTSLYGKLGLKTPRLEELAKQGMTFSRAYVASPSCAPSRAALLTGLMPARNGAEPNHAHPREDVKKWPAYFQELGYQVHAYGKVSHYKQTYMYGFDGFAHDTFHDEAAIPAAVEFLKERRALQVSGKSTTASKPLCLMVGTNWPHVPWPASSEGIDPATLGLPPTSLDTPATRAARAKLAAAVNNADRDLGLILDSTAQNLSSTNTLFLFSTDHGTQWPFGKWNLYEAGIRVPLVVRWPGHVVPGSRSDAMVSWVDYLPTLLECVGGTPPGDIDGKSFSAVLTGKATAHRHRIFATHSGDGQWNVYPTRCLTDGKFKYIHNLHPEFAFTCHIDLPGNLGRTKYWESWENLGEKGGSIMPSTPQKAPLAVNPKDPQFATFVVNRYHARPAEELYDLQADPYEQTNLAADPAQQQRLKDMRKQVDDWMTAQGDQKKVYGTPRLLSDPGAYGANARPPKDK